jgi:hypothetical protein
MTSGTVNSSSQPYLTACLVGEHGRRMPCLLGCDHASPSDYSRQALGKTAAYFVNGPRFMVAIVALKTLLPHQIRLDFWAPRLNGAINSTGSENDISLAFFVFLSCPFAFALALLL